MWCTFVCVFCLYAHYSFRKLINNYKMVFWFIFYTWHIKFNSLTDWKNPILTDLTFNKELLLCFFIVFISNFYIELFKFFYINFVILWISIKCYHKKNGLVILLMLIQLLHLNWMVFYRKECIKDVWKTYQV